ncbi:MAG: hypothetical protein KatS3mg117_1646 [Geminicoccaceae bacterium]|nr:MAG: hypothetical protein KatS3mg117_1646 [Geminicoccaceae bacterium]
MTAKTASTVLPKFDLEAWIALHKANLETAVAAQKVVFDFWQTVAKRQVEMMKESFAKFDGFVKGFDAKKQPKEYVDEAKAVIEKAMADAKETLDLGMKAQAEVVDLLVKRATANLDEVKSLAA